MASNQIQKSSRQLLDVRLPNMLSVVPESERERFRLAAYAVCLNKTYEDCTPESVLSSIFYCFRWGFEPDPARRQVYIVPFKDHGVKKAQPILGYNGLIDLARNADPSLVVRTGCVYENDEFQFTDGTERRLVIFKPHWLKGEAPGRMLFSWCAYKVASQEQFEIVVVPAKKLEALRDKQVGRGGAQTWGDPNNYPAMCEKTAIRQSAKKWTLAPHTEAGKRLRQAITDDEIGEDGLPELDTQVAAERAAQYGTSAVAAALAARQTPAENVASDADLPQVQPNLAQANHSAAPQDAPPAPVDAAMEAAIAVQWSDFVPELVRLARSAPGTPLADGAAVAAAINGFVLKSRMVKKEDQIKPDARRRLYQAVASGRLLPDGTITPEK